MITPQGTEIQGLVRDIQIKIRPGKLITANVEMALSHLDVEGKMVRADEEVLVYDRTRKLWWTTLNENTTSDRDLALAFPAHEAYELTRSHIRREHLSLEYV